jgi:hypothetical protein
VTDDGTAMPMRHLWRFRPEAVLPRFTDPNAAQSFLERLSPCAVEDLGEEIGILVSIAGRQGDVHEKARILRESLRLLNKLAHRKYRSEFADALAMLRTAAPRLDADASFTRGLDAVSARASKRLASSSARSEP